MSCQAGRGEWSTRFLHFVHWFFHIFEWKSTLELSRMQPIISMTVHEGAELPPLSLFSEARMRMRRNSHALTLKPLVPLSSNPPSPRKRRDELGRAAHDGSEEPNGGTGEFHDD